MKILLPLLLCCLVAGCGYNKSTVVHLEGEEVIAPIKGLGTIKGKNIKGTITRQVNLTNEKGKKLVVEEKLDNIHDSKVTIQ
jgi:hypothetical protein